MGLLSNGVDLLSGERVLENTPTPLFEQPRKFITHGRIFESLLFVTYTHSLPVCSSRGGGLVLLFVCRDFYLNIRQNCSFSGKALELEKPGVE